MKTNTRKIIRLAKELTASLSHEETEITVQDLFELTWREHWSQPRYIKSGWAQNIKNNYERNIKLHFGAERLSAITGVRVRAWHRDMGARPIAANRSLETLSKMFRFAEERELRAQGTNPCSIVKSFVEKRRKRFATPEEIQGIINILEREKERNREAVTFLYVLLYTGARPRSIEQAKLKDLKIIDYEGEKYGLLSFNGKSSAESGEEECVILPPRILNLVAWTQVNSNGKLFNCKMPRTLWKKIQDELGCHDLWARDLRRTFATIGLSNGVTAGALGQLLNHKSTQTTAVYAKLIEEEKIKSVKLIGEKIAKLVKEAV